MTRLGHEVPAVSSASGWKDQILRSPHGAPIGEAAQEALRAEIATRSAEAGAEGAQLQLSNLRLRRDGLPEGWIERRNLLLAAPDAGEVSLTGAFASAPPTNAVLALGRSAQLHSANLIGEGALIALGDDANLYAATISAHAWSTVLIGERTTATFAAQLDARNGGAVVIGGDGMWAHGVRIITDDMHAIRDVKTGRRLNGFGGRVLIGKHVWLCEQVSVIGNCQIGSDAIVGLGSIVTRDLPANSICVGRPARRIRRGVTWTREDAV